MEKAQLVQITRQNKIAENDFYPMIRAIYEQIWQNLLPPQIPTDGLTTRRAKNIVTPPDAPVPDCVTCGACCVAFPCVGVRPDNQIPEEKYWDITIEGASGEITVDRFLRRDGETLYCASLEVRDDGQALCRIYEQRPRMCRDFEAGSDKCHALRRAFGIEPFLSLEEMSDAMRKLAAKPPAQATPEIIKVVKFAPVENGELQIIAYLKDGSSKTIHSFIPHNETWLQFEFDGLTLAEAQDLIDSRAA